MSRRIHGPRRSRPDSPYRAVPIRRLLVECNRRLRTRGPRAFEAVAALVKRWPEVQSGIVYIGDEKLGGLMGRCGRTAHRAKYDLADAGLVRLHGAGRGMCPCSRCGGQAAGGKILNARGQLVSAATGFELDPSILANPASPRGSAPGPSRPGGGRHESPAERRIREAGQAKIRDALAQLRDRAGP